MVSPSFRNVAWSNLGFAAAFAAAAGIASVSGGDADSRALRYGVILLTAGAAFWMPGRGLVLAVPVLWLGAHYLQSQVTGESMFAGSSLLELPGLVVLAAGVALAGNQQRRLEEQANALDGFGALKSEIDEETGLYQERLLKESVERELARSRRFGREFALMLADMDEMRAKFDYREDDKWEAGFKATAAVLLNTRAHIDRVYRYGDRAFALLLPETGAKDITGLVRRLARAAKKAVPPEGEPGGPLPLHFGVTFFPHCATTVDDLLRRAEVALRIAEKNPTRVQLDGAEAPDMPAPELSRSEEQEELVIECLAGQWLGADAPDEEQPGIWLRTTTAVPWEKASLDSNLTASDVDVEEMEAGTRQAPRSADQPREPEVEEDRVVVEAVHREADAIAAQGWEAPVPTASIAGAENAGEAPLTVELSQMVQRMNETLAMFKDLRASGSPTA